jgi:hypothetical protein
MICISMLSLSLLYIDRGQYSYTIASLFIELSFLPLLHPNQLEAGESPAHGSHCYIVEADASRAYI